MGSLMWAVRDALLDVFAAPAAAAGADLFDGPRPRGDTPTLFVVVGADSDDPFEAPDDVDDTLTGRARQEWASEGPGDWRRERGSVLCTAVGWTGDDDLRPLRATVADLVDELELALVANRQLGDAVGAGIELAELVAWERRRTDGIAVGALLDVAYESILN